MNSRELEALVDQGESERLEFKASTGQLKEGCKTVCAMLNGLGGFVLFGVSNDGRVRGQSVTARTLEEITNQFHQIDPPAFPEIETLALNTGNSVIILRVSGGGGPYT